MAYMDGPPTDKGMGGKNRPNSKVKVAARRVARKASGMSAQKFYVTTRMAEAAKGGKTVNRADLRKKFQSGDVARKGFGAPKKKTVGAPKKKTGGTGTGTGSKVTGTVSGISPTGNKLAPTFTPSTKKSTPAPSASKSSSPKASGTSTKLQDDKIKMLQKLPSGKLRDNKLKEQMILRDKIRNKPTNSSTKLQDDKIAMLRAQPQSTLRDNKLKEQMALKKRIALKK